MKYTPYITRYTIKDMQEIAETRGGKCLSENYENSLTKLTWRCEKGHTWEATPVIIRQGGWCRQCNKTARRKLSLKEMQQLAISRGGKCLSEEYINKESNLIWRCKEGHIWSAKPGNVKNRSSWCPQCAQYSARLTIAEMHQIAKNKGGECLSEEYTNNATKLKWRCGKGHVWEARPLNIRSGYWCHQCGKDSNWLTIQEMQQLAKRKDGKCLSEKYINKDTRLTWQCEKGHIWKVRPYIIKKGKWCPACALNRTKTRKSPQIKN